LGSSAPTPPPPPPPPPPFVSVVVTVRNEAPHLRELLESLLVQEPPLEVVLVDSESRDGTFEIAEDYARRAPDRIRVLRRSGSRGIGRNAGAHAARGEFLAFIDGDCVADSKWIETLREAFRSSDVVAGRTVAVGRPVFASLERVELYQGHSDVTFPTCNLGYRRQLFERLGGFDVRFITAEDIDLNIRAVNGGARIRYVPEAIVYHRTRSTLVRFLYQAFWNGYGRKQLTEKYGVLWGRYRYRRLLSRQWSVLAWARMVAALAGYFTRVLTGGDRRLNPVEEGPAAIALAEPKEERHAAEGPQRSNG
jgi:glycosyltransferase involved in cell wall biosynthesis